MKFTQIPFFENMHLLLKFLIIFVCINIKYQSSFCELLHFFQSGWYNTRDIGTNTDFISHSKSVNNMKAAGKENANLFNAEEKKRLTQFGNETIEHIQQVGI